MKRNLSTSYAMHSFARNWASSMVLKRGPTKELENKLIIGFMVEPKFDRRSD